jgi:hypothetical protein
MRITGVLKNRIWLFPKKLRDHALGAPAPRSGQAAVQSPSSSPFGLDILVNAWSSPLAVRDGFTQGASPGLHRFPSGWYLS